MNTFFRCLALTPLLSLVAACCANNPCSREDLQADTIYLTLKRDTGIPSDTTGFTTAELDTVYLRRYSPASPNTPSDPVAIVRGPRLDRTLKSRLVGAKLDSNTVVISNTSPFSPSVAGGKLSAYNYLLTVKDGRRGAHTYNFNITNIVLTGQYNADGCCTTYQNTSKRFQVNNGGFVEETQTAGPPTGPPISVTLSRP